MQRQPLPTVETDHLARTTRELAQIRDDQRPAADADRVTDLH
ncbi:MULTISPECIES: hypothetical protein [Streptomyces]|nr:MULTISPECIES: hypothetical protein [Streptomyces]